MKKSFMIFLILAFGLALFSAADLFAQKSSAELITTIHPPKLNDDVQINDGERQIEIYENNLLISNYWAGLRLYDISDITKPIRKASVQMDDEAYNSFTDGKYVYFSNDAAGVQIFELNNLRKVTQIKTPGGAHWVTADNPYLFVALGDAGFCIMSIADMNHPITLALEIPAGWVQQLVKRDNLLFMAAKKAGVIIYDVSSMDSPQKISQFRTRYDAMEIQVIDNYAFVADGPGGLLILDISNPQLPVQVSRFSTGGFVSDVYKAGNYAYLANQNVGLQIVNLTDLENPFLEGQYETESESYSVFKKDIYVFLAANTTTLIMRHNNKPQLEDIPDLTLKEGEPFQLALHASEPDGDQIVLEALNLPEGSTFDAQNGVMDWTPTYEQSGEYKDIIFKATEQTHSMLSAADTVTITVEHVNRVPDLPPLENKTVDENSSLTFTIPEGSDPDQEDQGRLTYLAENIPEGAIFDSTTRTFSWTPTFEQSGTYIVDFLLDDKGGGLDREPVTITVNQVDRQPEIDPISDKEIDENQPLTISLSGSDPDAEDQDKISFKMENIPEGAEFNAQNRMLAWTPTYDQAGSYPNIKAIMIAGEMSDTSTFSITVNHVNRAPVLADIGDKTVNENEELTFSLDINDPDVEDANKLRVSTENLPMGSSFDSSTYQFNWTPTYEQSGTYPGIGFIVQDPSGLTDRKEITITVNHVNRAPSIEDVPDQTVDENVPVEIQLAASDPDREDQGRLVFSGKQIPDGAKLDSQSGLFQWTPTYEQAGVYDIFFAVSDGSYSDSTFTRITVENVNRPPVLAEIGNQTIDENQPLTFTIRGSDPDSGDQGKLAYSAQNAPEGAAFDPQNLTFEWMPTYEQSGEYQMMLSVADPEGLSDQKTVAITVNHVNRPPTLEAIADQSVDESQSLTIQLVGSDPDKEDAGQLTYQVSNLPQGANLDQANGVITWTPTFDQSGEYQLTAQVSDAAGLQAEQTFTITVNNVNRPPALEVMAPQTGKENSSLTFTMQANDPDKEDAGELEFSATGLPEGATFSSSTGDFFWTPTYEQSGDYPIDFQVTDSFGASDNTQVTITIENVNRPPVIEGIGKKTVNENEKLEFILSGTDPDKEDQGKVRLRAVTLPTGASFDAGSGQFSWTPTYEQSGRYVIEFEATDPKAASVTETVIAEVENVNRSPEIDSPGNKSVKERETLSFKVTASDPDMEDQGNLQLSADNLPSGAQFRPNGEFTWTPGIDQQGSYDITFTVKDTGGMSGTASISVQVEDVVTLPEEQGSQPQSPDNQ